MPFEEPKKNPQVQPPQPPVDFSDGETHNIGLNINEPVDWYVRLENALVNVGYSSAEAVKLINKHEIMVNNSFTSGSHPHSVAEKIKKNETPSK